MSPGYYPTHEGEPEYPIVSPYHSNEYSRVETEEREKQGEREPPDTDNQLPPPPSVEEEGTGRREFYRDQYDYGPYPGKGGDRRQSPGYGRGRWNTELNSGPYPGLGPRREYSRQNWDTHPNRSSTPFHHRRHTQPNSPTGRSPDLLPPHHQHHPYPRTHYQRDESYSSEMSYGGRGRIPYRENYGRRSPPRPHFRAPPRPHFGVSPRPHYGVSPRNFSRSPPRYPLRPPPGPPFRGPPRNFSRSPSRYPSRPHPRYPSRSPPRYPPRPSARYPSRSPSRRTLERGEEGRKRFDLPARWRRERERDGFRSTEFRSKVRREVSPPPLVVDRPHLKVDTRYPEDLTSPPLTEKPKLAPKKFLLVCDLNGVLVFRTKRPPHNPKVRPHAHKLMPFLFEHFHVAVWSSAMRSNVDRMVKAAFPRHREQLLLAWSREQCDLQGSFNENCASIKDIQKVWSKVNTHPDVVGATLFGAHNTLVLDDSPTKIAYQPRNQIRIAEYGAINPKDTELTRLLAYLQDIVSDMNNCPDPTTYDVRDYLDTNPFTTFSLPPPPSSPSPLPIVADLSPLPTTTDLPPSPSPIVTDLPPSPSPIATDFPHSPITADLLPSPPAL